MLLSSSVNFPFSKISSLSLAGVFLHSRHQGRSEAARKQGASWRKVSLTTRDSRSSAMFLWMIICLASSSSSSVVSSVFFSRVRILFGFTSSVLSPDSGLLRLAVVPPAARTSLSSSISLGSMTVSVPRLRTSSQLYQWPRLTIRPFWIRGFCTM